MSCLYRLSDGTFVHCSERGQSVVFRWYTPAYSNKKYTLPHDSAAYEDLLAGAKCISLSEAKARLGDLNLGLDPERLNVKRSKDWQKVFEVLETVDWSRSPEINSPWGNIDPGLALTHAIPQTQLRRFYDVLRTYPGDKVHKPMVSYLSKSRSQASKLQVLFANSASHFARYRNIKEDFCDPKRPWNPAGKEARQLITQLLPNGKGGEPVPTGDGVPSCKAIAYEVSPYRTTHEAFSPAQAFFENGMSGEYSGGGGIDLLMQSDEDGLPIIGEIKASTDTNLFLGLIQALTYAVELTTPNQLERLKKWRGTFQLERGSRPCCDIYLIYFKEKSGNLKLDTIKLAEALLENRESPVARIVRRIVFVMAVRDDDGPYRLTLAPAK